MKTETKMKIDEALRKIGECYLFYRCLFLINVPAMIYVPLAVLVLREHVDGIQIFNSCTGWIFSILYWKNMRWDLFIEECQTIWRDICEQIKRHK